jgi:hypothetical protein
MKNNPAGAGGFVDEYADVVECLWVFGHVGFFYGSLTMRAFIGIMLLVAVGIGVAGFALGWFKFSSSPNEEKRDLTLTVDPDKMKQDRDKAVGFLHSGKSSNGEKTDTTAAEGETKGREKFHQQAETRLRAMDRGLVELKSKAKTSSGEARDRINEAVDDLSKRTDSAREELKELQGTSQEGYDAVKTRFSAAMTALKDDFEKAGTRLQE